MPPGDGETAVITEDETALTSKSRRFLNSLSIFHSKRASATTAPHHHHHRGASLDSSTPPKSHWHPKFCEQPLEPTQPVRRSNASHHESTIRNTKSEISKDEDPRRGSRASLWVRIVGRIAGKNKVREEISASRTTDHAKIRSQPKKYKWVSCEDLSRVISTQKDLRRDELVKPVLEPVHFTATDRPDEEPTRKILQTRKTSQTRKMKLEILTDQRVIEECKSAATHQRSKKDQSAAAATARTLATTHPAARTTLASLVAMLDFPSSRPTALLTLHALASGNDPNKAAIVDAGAVPKLLQILESHEESVVANLLSLSALDRNKPLLAPAIQPLVARLGKNSLRALYNLSLAQSNVKFFVESNAAPAVMTTLTTHLADEKALAVLGNMVATPAGRKSVASSGFEPLISALGYGVKCQERAAYILMVLAHHSPEVVSRRAIPALLEVSLLGSALAQNRAVRVLECLRERGRSVSAPLRKGAASHSDSIPRVRVGHEGSEVVDRMVRESLERNLERIVRRAGLPVERVRGGSVALSECSSSKSSPF